MLSLLGNNNILHSLKTLTSPFQMKWSMGKAFHPLSQADTDLLQARLEKITMIAPTNFIKAYMQQNYQHLIRQCCTDKNYQLEGIRL